jgi:copper chaperone
MAYNVTLNIPAISCGHCVKTIERETADVPGVLSVAADAQAKTATYTLVNEAALPKVKETLEEIGYPAQ